MTKRWMAEITYRNGDAPTVVQFEELAELHDIVEMWADWNEIEQIVITLNVSSATQLGDVDDDPAGPVAGKQLGRRAPTGLVLKIDIGELLPVGVADNVKSPAVGQTAGLG